MVRYKKLDKHKLQPADHIVQPGAFGVEDVFHHALYVGNGVIIHYYGNPYRHPSLFGKVQCEIRFDNLSTLERAAEKMGTTLVIQQHDRPVHTRKQAIKRANSRLGEKNYNLFTNNCEHFVNWAIEGLHTSLQIVD